MIKDLVAEKNHQKKNLLRLELVLAPLLISIPIIVSFFLFNQWFTNSVLEGNPMSFGLFFLASFILFGNLLFDIPFIHSIIKLSKKKKQ